MCASLPCTNYASHFFSGLITFGLYKTAGVSRTYTVLLPPRTEIALPNVSFGPALVDSDVMHHCRLKCTV